MKLRSGHCKNLRLLAWWKISKRLRVAKPPCRIPQWSFKNSLKKLAFSFVLSYVSRGISSSKYFSSETSIEKTRIEGRRVAYFFQTIIPHYPLTRNSPASRFDSLTVMFKVNQPLIFLFLSKIGAKMATKTKDSKNKLYKNHDILYNMLFLIVFFKFRSAMSWSLIFFHHLKTFWVVKLKPNPWPIDKPKTISVSSSLSDELWAA